MTAPRQPHGSAADTGREPQTDSGHIDEDTCRKFQRSVETLGRKWSAAVLLATTQGTRRFSEYRTRIPGISNQLLSQRLRELESHGLIERVVVPTTPVQITYLPTDRGVSLMGVLHPLIEWSDRNEE
ncbi:helix-turn-helix domain-containing protein [Streptomyces sp. NPDC049916]|uniref:winged helix-turn-helix transcriptional regulator n=1 Tax=Streptomyces sp. NPDC049916 TaxID=3155156 RepID=UPI003419BB6B